MLLPKTAWVLLTEVLMAHNTSDSAEYTDCICMKRKLPTCQKEECCRQRVLDECKLVRNLFGKWIQLQPHQELQPELQAEAPAPPQVQAQPLLSLAPPQAAVDGAQTGVILCWQNAIQARHLPTRSHVEV